MTATSIEWTDVTWNPVRGCSRVSEGCRHCYAERIAGRFSGAGQKFEGFARGLTGDYHGGTGVARTNGTWRWTGRVELVPSKLDEPLRWRKPRQVFVNSMSDLFHEALADEAIAAVFGAMALAPQHTFQILTKRPGRARAWFDWLRRRAPQDLASLAFLCVAMAQQAMRAARPDARVGRLDRLDGADGAGWPWPLPNVWLGVSVEDQATADERIPLLLRTPAAVRWVSYEPALGPVDFGRYIGGPDEDGDCVRCGLAWSEDVPDCPPGFGPRVDWLVIGGESGPGARPFMVEWARSTIAACRAAGVPVFCKQLGARPLLGSVREEFDPPMRHGRRGVITARITETQLRLASRKGGDPSEWPEDLRVREWPR